MSARDSSPHTSPEPDPSRSSSISLDELKALCDEMVSLARAGVPLDRGLLELAEDLPEKLAVRAREFGEQLSTGRGLAEVVFSTTSPFPAVYRSVVEAGVRSGNLTIALEGFARLARHLSELRRLVVSSLVYPLLLLLVLIIISIALVSRLGPQLRDSLLSIKGRGAETDWAMPILNGYAAWTQWFWILPVVLFVVGWLWFVATQAGGLIDWINWVPGAGRLLRNSRLQAFTETLGLLVQQRVPLNQGLRLAGAASGDRHIQVDAELLATQIEQGATHPTIESSSANPRGIPPFLRWSLANGSRVGLMEKSLARASLTYRRRTEDSVEWMRRSLPVIFSFSLGGLVTFLYAATVFVPWYTMLRSLGDAMGAV